MAKTNYIFGVILNLDWKAIAPFFISFQKAHFNNCDCAMFVKNLSQETINKIESFNMTIIKMQRSIKVRLVNYRYKLYEDFLRNNSEKYNLILSGILKTLNHFYLLLLKMIIFQKYPTKIGL